MTSAKTAAINAVLLQNWYEVCMTYCANLLNLVPFKSDAALVGYVSYTNNSIVKLFPNHSQSPCL